MVDRKIASFIRESAYKYPIISLTGPRQSGKTTIVRKIFPDYKYLSIERPDVRAQALEDPIRFLHSFTKGMILDEVQKAPELFSYLQTIVDENQLVGRYILTGSQNFLLSEKISQSLAGRVRIFRLLPFSQIELKNTKYNKNKISYLLFNGMYPPIYDRTLDPYLWYQDYIETYLERDVRSLKNITNLSIFQKFMKLCAGRIGQLLNLNSLSIECGITHNTARDWISILEASYIVFRLNPYHANFNKRIVKQPKLYFYDTGLACSLLGIEKQEQLSTHYIRGALFESFIISEYLKFRFNEGKRNNSYFWRDRYGHEVDLLIQTGSDLLPIEIKSGETINNDFFNHLSYWSKLSGNSPKNAFLIYGGTEKQNRNNASVYGWRDIESCFNCLKK